ncbi:MAG: fused MFS/spermidine synthase [Nitrospinota bacterium]|nr:fused MFS/spermidine synthase [Nitrospinota bacterium]
MSTVTQPSRLAYIYFFISGITALVYEIIWTRQLTLVFGHTVYSVSIVLSAFMAGLGFGSYVWGHMIDRAVAEKEKTPPLLVYGRVELLIFATSAVLSLIFSEFDVFYAWMHRWLPDSPVLFNAIKAALAFLLMFIPTTFMGATLPIISKYYVTDNTRLGTQIGYLYSINTLGAAVGCILTGFLFISTFGVLQTALFASCANLLIGIGCIRIYQEEHPGEKTPWRLPRFEWPTVTLSAGQKLWMGIAFVCGFTALAYEVLWTRLLVFSIASTVYSFSLMLAVFLLGICIGSLVVVPLMARTSSMRTVLIALQAGIGLYVLFTLFSMESLLSAPWNSYSLTNPGKTFLHYFKDSAMLMLFPTLLFGMSFPVLIKLAAGDHEHVGGGTGQIYASNTLGAIFGSLAAGFVFLPWLGTEKSLMVVATLNLLTVPWLFGTGDYSTPALRKGVAAVTVVAVIALNVVLPGNLLDRFFMRDSAGKRDLSELMYFEEGLTDTVAVFKDGYGILDPTAKRLITNGISMSASNSIATRYMKLLAHVPILLVDNPQDVMVICFGTGQTTGAAGIHPIVGQVDSVELSSSVLKAAPSFQTENHDVADNPKVNFVVQDGRNFLLTTQKKYDVITGEPPPPRTAFTVNLYTQDFYEAARDRLKPGGIMAQWIPLHSQSAEEVDMHFKTFLSVFPHAIAWMSVANEMMVIGSDQPIQIDFGKLKARMAEPAVAKALQDIFISDVHSLLSSIWFLEKEMEAISKGRPLITDNRPRIEFYLDYGKVIGSPGLERLVFNRTPVEEVLPRIAGMDYEGTKHFKRQYRAMDLYQRGVMYSNRGLLLEAIELSGDGDLPRYHLQAGRGQIDRLLEQQRKEPDNLNILLNLGHAFYQIGEYARSVEYLEKVLEREPRQGIANLYMGYNLLELERWGEARAKLEAAAKNDMSQMRTVMQEIALIELIGQVREKPEDLSLLNALAQFYNMKNDYGRALKYSSRILENDPMNEEALKSALFSYRGRGEPREVIGAGIRFEMVKPDDIHFQFIMAEIYFKTLRCGKAIPYLEKILKVDDTYPNAQRLMDACRVNPKDERPLS